MGGEGVISRLGEGDVFQKLGITGDHRILPGHGPGDGFHTGVVADDIQHRTDALTHHGAAAAADACPGSNQSEVRLLSVQPIDRQIVELGCAAILGARHLHPNLQESTLQTCKALVILHLFKFREGLSILADAQIHIHKGVAGVFGVPTDQTPAAALPAAVIHGALPASAFRRAIGTNHHIVQIYHGSLAVAVIIGQADVPGEDGVAHLVHKLQFQRQAHGLALIHSDGIPAPSKGKGAVLVFTDGGGGIFHAFPVQPCLVGNGGGEGDLVAGVVVDLIGKPGHGGGDRIGIGAEQVVAAGGCRSLLHGVAIVAASAVHAVIVHLEHDQPHIGFLCLLDGILQRTDIIFTVRQHQNILIPGLGGFVEHIRHHIADAVDPVTGAVSAALDDFSKLLLVRG